MPTSPKRKVTYSLPQDLVNEIAQVVREGAAPSYSAFVERALNLEVRRAREKALADAQLKIRKDEQDRGFKKNLAYLSSIKPENAKFLLQDMKESDSVRFLLEMEPDTGKKIIDKCITQEDRQWIGRVLDQIRARDVLRAEALVAHSSRKKR